VRTSAAAVVDADCAGYELDYVDETGQSRRGPLSLMWGVPFERVDPVRSFRWSKGLRHWSGWWWSSTSNRHIGFESWLEQVMRCCWISIL
jgi:hypothetical protein